jgi:serine/threonine protein kinase
MDATVAAERLAGLDLQNGWIVSERIIREEGATGGAFSVGYVVESGTGHRAFLKALDFSSALEAENPADELARLLATYEHERKVLQVCKDRKIKRVALPIAEGVAVVPGFDRGGRVNYLIFELAEGDARAHLSRSVPTDISWKLRSLHHIASGLNQLHVNLTAHQDVKPSNVLTFGSAGWKLGDLGRASRQGFQAPHDEIPIAGDFGYAPPELLYRQVDPDWIRRRFGCDAYLLGNLAIFFFAGVSLTAWMHQELNEDLRFNAWSGTYQEVLPFVRSTFNQCMDKFESHLRGLSGRLAEKFIPAIKQLCEPDPSLRGDPRNRKVIATQYSLIRYVSLFDDLAGRAEHGVL